MVALLHGALIHLFLCLVKLGQFHRLYTAPAFAFLASTGRRPPSSPVIGSVSSIAAISSSFRVVLHHRQQQDPRRPHSPPAAGSASFIAALSQYAVLPSQQHQQHTSLLCQNNPSSYTTKVHRFTSVLVTVVRSRFHGPSFTSKQDLQLNSIQINKLMRAVLLFYCELLDYWVCFLSSLSPLNFHCSELMLLMLDNLLRVLWLL
ncbi:hypothetical protein PIB30_009850 [Stylosanthes scabra]|uniref:Uncharacterized protein n=1 Tax=Stylosanthes scabra TaxID=79078 RepID=A0ABU6Q5H6_9FABA|nr:hypothetical protein [Stylosanthes scabra]